MSVELLPHGHDQQRSLHDDEKKLLRALLSSRADFQLIEKQIADAKVVDMHDGGMGSVKFVTADMRSLGATLLQAEYLDVDGVLVSIAVNADNQGDLYEIDFWKADFSPLKQYPQPELVKIN